MTLPYTHRTLAERREIYRLRSAGIAVAVIAQRLGRHPSTIYRNCRLLKHQLGIDSSFCKPQAPWQKGTVETANGRVRRFLSRDTDIAVLSEETLLDLCERLNETPRKGLGDRTPAEVLMRSLDPGLPRLSNPDQRSPGKPWVRGSP